MPYTKQQLLDTLHTLPEEIQEAVASISVAERFAEIGKKAALHIDKQGILSGEILYLMMGLTKPEGFVPSLVSKLSITQSQATVIAKDVDILILSPIRHTLQEIHKNGPQSKPETIKEVRPEPLQTAAGNIISAPLTPPPAPTSTSTSSTTNLGPIPNLRTMPKDIARIKMEESIRMPKEEIGMRYSGDNKDSKGGKYASDPYREKTQ